MIKDNVINLIIAFVRDHGHDTGSVLDTAFNGLEIELRETVSWHMKRDEYKAEVVPTLKKIDSNLDTSLKHITFDDPKFIIKMHNILRNVSNFAHIYINLSK